MNSFMMLSPAAFGLPAVHAKAAETTSDGTLATNNSAKKVKVSSIPLYPEPVRREYSAQPPNKLEEFVKRTRIQATNIKAEYQPIIDKIVHVADTGKAHTSRNQSPYLFAIAQIVQFLSNAEAIWNVRNDTTTRVGVMALGGMVTGLIAAKRSGLYNKMSSLLIGLGGTGMLCYPQQTKILASDTGKLALKNARVAYHFVVGARPAVPNENGKPFDRVVGMTVDIGKWGFNLFEKMKHNNLEHEVTDARPEHSSTLDSENEVSAYTEPTTKEDAFEGEIIAKSTLPTKAHEEPNILAKKPSTPAQSQPIPEKENESAGADPSSSTTTSLNFPSEDSTEDEGKTLDGCKSANVQKPENGEESVPAAVVVYEGDLGQSTLEDKVLYTTRE